MKRILTLVLSSLVVLGSVFTFPSCSSLDDLNTITPEQNVSADGMLITPGDEEGITLASRKLAVAEYEEYGVAAAAESSYSITATVLPEDAGNKEIDWALSFVDSSSEWAQDKSVQDYVSLAISDTQATLSCVAAFGEQIQITVTSVADPTITANCTLDYAQRIRTANLRIGNYISSAYDAYEDASGYRGVVYPSFEVSRSISGEALLIEVDPYLTSTYTIADEFSYSVSFEMPDQPYVFGYENPDDPLDSFDDANYSYLLGYEDILCDRELYNATLYLDYTHFLSECSNEVYESCSLVEENTFDWWTAEELARIFSTNHHNNNSLGIFKVVASGKYSTFNFTIDLVAVNSINSTSVESVAFDCSNFVF